MLVRIECDKFLDHGKPRGPITFHKGANVIFGDGKKNSLGKSTFLLIIDFCFGGKDYITIENETIRVIGHHKIYFDFIDHSKIRYFSRSTENKEITVSEYTDSFHQVEKNTYDLQTFNKILLSIYNLDDLNLTMRAIVSKFFRIYNRNTINELRPLNTTLSEDDQKGIVNLLKLYKVDNNIEALLKERNAIEDKYKYFIQMKKESNDKIVTTNEGYQANIKEIEHLESEIERLKIDTANGSADAQYIIPLRKNELIVQIKALRKQIARLRYSKNNIVAKDIDEISTNKTIDKLREFFPHEDFQPLYKIEEFHRSIRKVLVQEANEQNKRIDDAITAIESKIKIINKELAQYEKTPIITNEILDEFNRNNEKLKILKEANDNYLKFKDITKKKTYIDEQIVNNSKNDIDSVMNKINSKMAQLERDYDIENYYPPELKIKDLNSYSFGILRDTGTANRYKAVITFDTTIINQTKLPCFIHDSIFFNSLGDDNMHYVLNLYKTVNEKQIFLAFDDPNKIHNDEDRNYLVKHTILSLSEGEGALFGREFNKKEQ